MPPKPKRKKKPTGPNRAGKGKGKVHGQGGAKGHDSITKRAVTAKGQVTEQRIKRRQAKRLRKLHRVSMQQMDKIMGLALRKLQHIGKQCDLGHMTGNTAIFATFGLFEWYAEKMAGIEILEADGSVRHPSIQEIDYLVKVRSSWMKRLEAMHITERELRSQVAKWKRRVEDPHYFPVE